MKSNHDNVGISSSDEENYSLSDGDGDDDDDDDDDAYSDSSYESKNSETSAPKVDLKAELDVAIALLVEQSHAEIVGMRSRGEADIYIEQEEKRCHDRMDELMNEYIDNEAACKDPSVFRKLDPLSREENEAAVDWVEAEFAKFDVDTTESHLRANFIAADTKSRTLRGELKMLADGLVPTDEEVKAKQERKQDKIMQKQIRKELRAKDKLDKLTLFAELKRRKAEQAQEEYRLYQLGASSDDDDDDDVKKNAKKSESGRLGNQVKCRIEKMNIHDETILQSMRERLARRRGLKDGEYLHADDDGADADNSTLRKRSDIVQIRGRLEKLKTMQAVRVAGARK